MTDYARCPQCGSTTLAVIEVHDEVGQTDFGRHEVVGRYIFPSSEFTFTPGDPNRVEMDCGDCGHQWRSRRVVGA